MLDTTKVTKHRTQGVTQHLSALTKRRLHNLYEQCLVTSQLLRRVSLQADNSTLDLWGWVKDLLAHGEEILSLAQKYLDPKDLVTVVVVDIE